jgi:queuine/archaeosine tRNA-ribosyltransferase
MLSRVARIGLGSKSLTTPAYFPAVSSVGVGYSVNALIRLILATKYPRLLVSAYDTYRISNEGKTGLLSQLGEFSTQGSFLLLDSGIFESYWRGDRTWTFESYANAVSRVQCDLYCSFDVFPDLSESEQDFFEETRLRILRSSSVSGRAQCVPILHGLDPRQLVVLVERLVEGYPDGLSILAISEKDCGFTLLERARTITKIRRALDCRNDESILHILGCGNPISLLLYSYCGADTYDSLDWSRHVIDRRSLSIGDLSHLELSKCNCAVCKKEIGAAAERALLHNLLFYQEFAVQIQEMIRDNSIASYLSDRVGRDALSKIDNRVV